MDEDRIIMNRTLSAYFGSLRITGSIVDQPANTSGIRECKGKRYAVLENIKSILAVYRIKNDGYLKRLKRWPSELEN